MTIEQTVTCPECGNTNRATKQFCPSCGFKLRANSEPYLSSDDGRESQRVATRTVPSRRFHTLGVAASLLALALVGAAVGFVIGSLHEEAGKGMGGSVGSGDEVALPANFAEMPEVLPLEANRSTEPAASWPHFQLTERGYQLVTSDGLELQPVAEPVNAPSFCGSIDYGLSSTHGLAMVEGYGLGCDETFRILTQWLGEEGDGAPPGWICWRAWWPRTEELRCTSGDRAISFLPF